MYSFVVKKPFFRTLVMQALVEREMKYDERADKEVQNSLNNSYTNSLLITTPQQITILKLYPYTALSSRLLKIYYTFVKKLHFFKQLRKMQLENILKMYSFIILTERFLKAVMDF